MLCRRAVLATFIGCLTNMTDIQMTAEQLEAARLREAFLRDPEAMLRKGFAFDWWCHGGGPGPDWLSDKLDLASRTSGIFGVYIRARPAAAPPFKISAEDFTGTVPKPLVAALLAALFDSRLFEKTVPSELRKNLMDAMIQTFDVTVGAVRLQKTLFSPDSEELGASFDACEAIARELREHGSRRNLPPATPL
jgi:hypothetical protein